MTADRRFTAWNLVLSMLLVATVGAADLERSPVPAWVLAPPWQPAPPTAASSPADYQDLLRDYQVNVATHELYVHYAFRFLTSRAVQEASTVSLDYAPDYQTVRLHTLTLWRDGLPIDQRTLEFRNLQRETRLDELLYDGTQTWVGFLRDVRPGDVLEVATTTQGDNPIFGGQYGATFALGSSLPVDRWSLRVVAPPGHSPVVRALGSAPRLATRTVDGLEVTSVAVEGVPAVVRDDNAPSDSQPGGRYVVSDWPTWGAVVRWALPWYRIPRDPKVNALAARLTGALTSPETKAVALLEYVQDQVRYLGIEVGVNSHQPHSPVEVLQNGFGDCKDKVVLYCALAEAAGLDAWPVLVDTRDGELVRANGPTPLAFNHVIAAVATPSGPAYVDPTADHQGGPLAERTLGAFRYGLELKDGVTALTPLKGASPGRRELVQTYRIPSFRDAATVKMDYTFTGSDADYQRSRWDGRDPAQWRKNTNEWLHDAYGDAQVAAGPTVTDDRAANVLRLTFEFSVRDLWKLDSGAYKAEFYPSLIGDNLSDPERVAARTQPYRLEHPETLRQVRRLELPDSWNLTPVEKVVNGPGFRVKATARLVDAHTVEFADEYVSLADRVEPTEWDAYLKALREARVEVSWTLTHAGPEKPAPTPRPSDPSPELTRLGGVIVGVLAFLIGALFQGSDF